LTITKDAECRRKVAIDHKTRFDLEQMSPRPKKLILFFAINLFLVPDGHPVRAQVTGPAPAPVSSPTPTLERRLLKNILEDQAYFWSMPAHLKGKDVSWIAPLSLFSGIFVATDRDTAGALGNNRTRLRISRRISRFGALYSTSATAALFYLAGRKISDPRLRETGSLAFEATLDGVVVSEVLKTVTQRPRPMESNGSGRFFHGGRSFPSGHSINAWALASIVAHEYSDSRTMQVLSYGVAGAVSISRFTSRAHFLSDVLVGSAIGYGIGTHVFYKRHDKGNPARTRSESKTELMIVPQYSREARMIGGSIRWRF